jgi:hypothetical protein
MPDYDSATAGNVTHDTELEVSAEEIEAGNCESSVLELPANLQKYLRDNHPVGHRSDHFHRVVHWMKRLGYNAKKISKVLEGIKWCSRKYNGRILKQVRNSLSKSEVYNEAFTAIDLDDSRNIELGDCPPLNSAAEQCVEKYCALNSITNLAKIKDTYRFIGTVFSDKRFAIIKTACGLGKSTAAIIHIALNAGSETPFILVVPDRATAKGSAFVIGELSGRNKVGLYLGWNEMECSELCGEKYMFKDCLRSSSRSKCRKCESSVKCAYFLSSEQLTRSAVVTTRQAFIGLCEKNHDFSSHTVIFDEDIMKFCDEFLTFKEIGQLQSVFAGSPDPGIRSLLPNLFPTLKLLPSGHIDAFAKDDYIRYQTLDEKLPPGVLGKVIRFLRKSSNNLGSREDLLFRFLLYFRSASLCNASFAYAVDTKGVFIKKDRVDLRKFTNFSKFFVLNASACVSLNEFSSDTPVLHCSDLDKHRQAGTIEVYAVLSHPTKSKRAGNMFEGCCLLNNYFDEIAHEGSAMLLPHNISNEDSGGVNADDAEIRIKTIAEDRNVKLDIYRLSRGFLRGTNRAQHCTSAFFPSTGLFTSVTDIALHVCLRSREDVPWNRFVDSRGAPLMSGGRFRDKVFQEIYTRKCLSELHQGIFRTGVRCGNDVSVIIAVPSVDWLSILYSLSPFRLCAVTPEDHRHHRLCTAWGALVAMPAGTKLTKKEVAIKLGYTSKTGWKDHKGFILQLLAGHYECKKGNMVRK